MSRDLRRRGSKLFSRGERGKEKEKGEERWEEKRNASNETCMYEITRKTNVKKI